MSHVRATLLGHAARLVMLPAMGLLAALAVALGA